jgi:hypothetical protein
MDLTPRVRTCPPGNLTRPHGRGQPAPSDPTGLCLHSPLVPSSSSWMTRNLLKVRIRGSRAKRGSSSCASAGVTFILVGSLYFASITQLATLANIAQDFWDFEFPRPTVIGPGPPPPGLIKLPPGWSIEGTPKFSKIPYVLPQPPPVCDLRSP